MLMLELCCQSSVSLTLILGVGACTDPGTAECLFHSNEGFMSRDRDLIGNESGQ